MAILFLDPAEEAELRALYVSGTPTRDARFTEVWDGIEVVPPRWDNEHQELRTVFAVTVGSIDPTDRSIQIRFGGNVSDRAVGWLRNYRGPDVLVFLPGNPAVNHGTHWQGGLDFLVEILSPGEDPFAKFDFYAGVGTREVLLVFRDPWALELHQLRAGKLEPAGRSDLANPAVLTSGVLPLTFRLRVGSPRPAIEVAHSSDGRTWTA